MNGKARFAKPVASGVRARISRCLAMLMLAVFGSVAAFAQGSGFVYVANSGSNNVSAYTIDGATGALTAVPGSPFPADAGPFSVTVDPTGQFLYVANLNPSSNNVSAYTIDGATGALTTVPGSPFPAGTSPRGIAATAGPAPPLPTL